MRTKSTAKEACYGILGLGRFGSALAKSLAESGVEVIVVDNCESKVKELRQYTENAFVADELTQEVLQEIGIQNCDAVVVAIGERIDSCILATLNVVNLGVPKVIAKATTKEQGEVLAKLGAEVVYPEKDMALRLAKKLVTHSMLDYISLSNDIEITEIRISEVLKGMSVREADLRQRFGLNIIALEYNGITDIEIDPAYVFVGNECMVVVGKKESLHKFEEFME